MLGLFTLTPLEVVAAFIGGVLSLFGLGAVGNRNRKPGGKRTTREEREAAVTIDEARDNIGYKVIYRPPGWTGVAPAEEGVITSVNEIYVHVRYSGDVDSKATRPEDLELLKR